MTSLGFGRFSRGEGTAFLALIDLVCPEREDGWWIWKSVVFLCVNVLIWIDLDAEQQWQHFRLLNLYLCRCKVTDVRVTKQHDLTDTSCVILQYSTNCVSLKCFGVAVVNSIERSEESWSRSGKIALRLNVLKETGG